MYVKYILGQMLLLVVNSHFVFSEGNSEFLKEHQTHPGGIWKALGLAAEMQLFCLQSGLSWSNPAAPLEQSAQEKSAMDQSALVQSAMEQSVLEQSALKQSALEQSAL